MCLDRVSNGLEPACVTACPTGALKYGDREGMLSIARQRKDELTAQGHKPRIYGESELGGLGAIYILPETASAYGLLEDPKLPHARITAKWLLGIIPGAAILYAMWRKLQAENDEEKTKAEAKTGGE